MIGFPVGPARISRWPNLLNSDTHTRPMLLCDVSFWKLRPLVPCVPHQKTVSGYTFSFNFLSAFTTCQDQQWHKSGTNMGHLHFHAVHLAWSICSKHEIRKLVSYMDIFMWSWQNAGTACESLSVRFKKCWNYLKKNTHNYQSGILTVTILFNYLPPNDYLLRPAMLSVGLLLTPGTHSRRTFYQWRN